MRRRIVRSKREQQKDLTALLSDLTGVSVEEVEPMMIGPGALGWMIQSFDLDSRICEAAEQAFCAKYPWRTFIQEYRKSLVWQLIRERGAACDLCGGLGTDLHEAFVTRAQVRGWRQFYIFCPENGVFLCRKNHESPDRERLLELQRARGYDLDDQGRWPKIREVLKVNG